MKYYHIYYELYVYETFPNGHCLQCLHYLYKCNISTDICMSFYVTAQQELKLVENGWTATK